MPYITADRRGELAAALEPILTEIKERVGATGDLNYIITKVCLAFLDGKRSYALYNEVVGVLECAKLELYARLVRPYEQEKITANGDVYPARP